MNEKISIIIPIYNVEKYIEKCLESIKEQTYKNLEIILINDGSTDESEKICKEIIKNDERFILISTANYGVSHARNIGLNRVTGNYVIFIDSDDWIEKNMIEELYNKIQEANYDMAICDYYINDGENQIEHNELSNDKIITKKEIMYEHLYASNLFGGYLWNKLIRKCIINKIIFDERIKIEEDVVFLGNIFENTHKIVYVPQKKLYHYRKRQGSAINFNYSKKDLTKLLALEEILKIKNKYNLKSLGKLEYEYYTLARQGRYILKKYNLKNKEIETKITKITKKYFKQAWTESNIKQKMKVILLTIMPIFYGKIKDKN